MWLCVCVFDSPINSSTYLLLYLSIYRFILFISSCIYIFFPSTHPSIHSFIHWSFIWMYYIIPMWVAMSFPMPRRTSCKTITGSAYERCGSNRFSEFHLKMAREPSPKHLPQDGTKTCENLPSLLVNGQNMSKCGSWCFFWCRNIRSFPQKFQLRAGSIVEWTI